MLSCRLRYGVPRQCVARVPRQRVARLPRQFGVASVWLSCLAEVLGSAASPELGSAALDQTLAPLTSSDCGVHMTAHVHPLDSGMLLRTLMHEA